VQWHSDTMLNKAIPKWNALALILGLEKMYGDMTSVWLTPEIAHFAVSKCSSAYLSSPEHLHSPVLPCALLVLFSRSSTLPCALLRSLVLCHTPLCSAALPRALPLSATCLWAAFLHFTPCPPGIPCTPCTTFLLSYHLYPCSWTLRTLSI
jgi:hypothetical protein